MVLKNPSITERALEAFRQDYPYMKTPDELWELAQSVKGDRAAYRRAMKAYHTAQRAYSGIVHTLQSHAYYQKRNPQSDADEGFESFHGEPSSETVIIEDEIHEHEHLWVCGRLVEICVVTLTGIYLELSWEDRGKSDIPYLCSNEEGTQLYIEGGDQELDLSSIKMDGDRWVKDRMVVGEFAPPEGKRKYNITYRARKDFDGFEEIDYQHWLGEPSKDLRKPAAPFLEYEPRNHKLYITGGQYIIEKPLLGTSPGIEN